MTDAVSVLTLTGAALAGLAMLIAGMLAGWRGWLDLQRQRLVRVGEPASPSPAGARIEMADLKERIRKLEAIAAGIDL